MGTKTLGPDELLALVVLQRVLNQPVVDNENGLQGRCDLKVIDVSAGFERTSGHVEVTRLIDEEYARTTNTLGGAGGEVLRFDGRIDRYWSITVQDLRRREWLEAKSQRLPDLLQRLEADGIARLPSIGTLSRIESEVDIATAAGWDAIVAHELECRRMGIIRLASSEFRAGDGFATVRAEGAVRAGWPEAGPSKIVPWLSGQLASVRLSGELKKLRNTGSARQHLFLVLDRHPDLDTSIEMYVSDKEVGPPTEDPVAPEHLTDIWLAHTAPAVVTHWNRCAGWRRHALQADDLADDLAQQESG